MRVSLGRRSTGATPAAGVLAAGVLAAGVLAAGVLAAGVVLRAGPVGAAPVPSWSTVRTPPVGTGRGLVDLTGVSCSSVSWCVAVGSDVAPSPPQSGVVGLDDPVRPVIEAWDGHVWTVASPPAVHLAAGAADTVELQSVSCVSASACVAVGSAGGRTLAESWDGDTWTVDRTPALTVTGSGLRSVTCVTASSCAAVGAAGASGGSRPIIESWDGHAWSLVASPATPAGDYSGLTGISCVSVARCVAVGSAQGAGQFETQSIPVVESWNGLAWSLVTSPSVTGGGALTDVSCSTATACVAVGSRPAGGDASALYETWDGTRWSLAPGPSEAPPGVTVSGVSCTSTGCVTVGHGPSETRFVARSDGTTWVGVAGPVVTGPGQLAAVSCVAGGGCVAVGTTSDRTPVAALVLSDLAPPSRGGGIAGIVIAVAVVLVLVVAGTALRRRRRPTPAPGAAPAAAGDPVVPAPEAAPDGHHGPGVADGPQSARETKGDDPDAGPSPPE